MEIARVVETCVYVDDVSRAAEFYERVLDLDPYARNPPRQVFLEAGDGMLLLFDADETLDDAAEVPGHGASGPQHVAFAVEDVDAWRQAVRDAGVEIVAEKDWGEGTSFYFHDPADNVLELVGRDVWPVW